MSFLNFLIRVTFGIVYRVYFNRVQTKNTDKLPKDKPLIFIANHTNAFTDPVIPTIWLGRKMNFIARSDMFNTPVKNFVMRQMNILPAYRIQEGADQLHKNAESFKGAAEMLKKFEPIIMFSEGICVQERRMRSMKKGAARIILGAEKENDYNLDIQIVAVGINYESWNKFRKSVFINFSEPYSLKEFREQHKKNANVATTNLTRFIGEKLSKQMINIKSKHNDELVEQIEMIYMDESLRDGDLLRSKLENRYNFSISITEMVNRLDEEGSEKLITLKEKVGGYVSKLKELGLRDHLIVGYIESPAPISKAIARLIILLMGLPIYILGVAANFIPSYLSQSVARKMAKNIEFRASIKIVAGAILFPIYYLIQFKVFGMLVADSILFYPLLVASPIAGILAYHYWIDFKKFVGLTKLVRLAGKKKSQLDDLISKRSEIISMIKEGLKG
ncbi:MAG: 1-acyl-sn-glycerol-3-phosphate acyltransferase [Flavobacteriales bacterium]|nr:1-acyl-sn-glycerol-3-phosphate acyltransferase [Flavobacteriales bacterium]